MDMVYCQHYLQQLIGQMGLLLNLTHYGIVLEHMVEYLSFLMVSRQTILMR
ncbi:hypothetical protein D3C87_2200270 [compost metagenome]